MKTRTKVILLVFSAVMLIVSTVFATFAYLTSTTQTVKNTFTVGNVKIELDESDESTEDTSDRTKTGNQYHLLPGHTYVKDPTVTVIAKSENCYVRMFVLVNNISKLKAAFNTDSSYLGTDSVFLLQKLVDWNTDWEYFDCIENAEADTALYEFRYNKMIARNDNANTVLPALFTKISIPGFVDNVHIAYLESVSIDIYAHAMQADGFIDTNSNGSAIDEAWDNWTETTAEFSAVPAESEANS